MSIKSLAHVCIKTKDLQRTLDFYCGALGMQRIFDFTKNGEVIGCYFKASNDTFIEVFRTGPTEQVSDGQILSHFCFETDSIEKLRQTLLEQGYAPREIIMGADNALQFWIQDPNGVKNRVPTIHRAELTIHSSGCGSELIEVVSQHRYPFGNRRKAD